MSKASREILFIFVFVLSDVAHSFARFLNKLVSKYDTQGCEHCTSKKRGTRGGDVPGNLKYFKLMQISEQPSATCTCKGPVFNCAYISDTLLCIVTVAFWTF